MLVIFDFDGVLANVRGIHFEALNRAAEFWSDGVPTYEEHLQFLDGLPTMEKLKWFSENKGTPPDTWGKIWQEKQRITRQMMTALPDDPILRDDLHVIKDAGHKLACVSNSIGDTVRIALSALGILDLFDYVAGTDDVENYKPHPECYLRAMAELGHEPRDTVIVEDSPPGREAAARSGARVIAVSGPDDVTAQRVLAACEGEIPRPRWETDWTIVIPMAGAGSRFAQAGYTFPKPLIDVGGKPMIQAVVDNLGINGNYVFIVLDSHRRRYNLDAMLNLIAPDCRVVAIRDVTDGAARTVSLAADHVDDLTKPVLVANSDQLVAWDPARFAWTTERYDGLIATHTATHPKWSFVEMSQDRVVRVEEKNPISSTATCGIYWWRSFGLLLGTIQEMIANNDRVNGEFYLAPTYNYAIADGARVGTYQVDEMHGIGTPEDLEAYLRG